MVDQHRKIKDYRELNQDEIDLMNRIKEKGNEFGELLFELEQMSHEGLTSIQSHDRNTNLDNAIKDSKQGIMWAVRAVTLPESF